MIVTYGQCLGPEGDGKWRVRLGETFLPGAWDDERTAAIQARIHGASRRVLRTTFTIGARKVRAEPGVPAEVPAPQEPPDEAELESMVREHFEGELTEDA